MTDLQTEVRELIETNKKIKDTLSAQNQSLRVLRDVTNDAYRKGLEDAWEWVKKHKSKPDCCFDALGTGLSAILDSYDVHDAMAKMKAYEERKQQEDKDIQPGDEIEYEDGTRSIVLDKDTYCYYEFNENGCVNTETLPILAMKTGRHFDLDEVFDWKDEVNAD